MFNIGEEKSFFVSYKYAVKEILKLKNYKGTRKKIIRLKWSGDDEDDACFIVQIDGKYLCKDRQIRSFEYSLSRYPYYHHVREIMNKNKRGKRYMKKMGIE